MYFKSFDNILYDFEINDERKLLKIRDITTNVRFRTAILSNVTLFDEYDIQDGDTPEILAERIYGSPEYHWVIMIANDKHDWIADFPLTYPELEKFLTQKYGSGNEDDVHHYIDNNGYVVYADHAEATSVSNRQYEEAENEAKRRIKIVSPSLLQKIINSFEDIV